jgi:AraC-like DNA-binding protein
MTITAMEPFVDGAVGRPAPPLRPFVGRYTGYWLDGFGPGTHQGLPSGSLTMVLTLGPPVDLTVLPDPNLPPVSYDALVGGLHAAPVTISYEQVQRGVQVDLTPFGARALFGVPAGELGSSVVGLDALLGRRADQWLDRLRSAPTWAARFAVLDHVLLAALVDGPPPPAEVVRAWDRLVATGGGIEVGALASEVGWSRRHLAQRFQQELGLAPKVAGRVLRFDRARLLLGRPARPGIAAVAARCGYYDQAHLTRDFRELAGMSPTAWLAEQLPSVQDDVVAAGA